MIRLNNIPATPGARQKKKILGRGIGSGLGKTAGRGHKGQNARKSGNTRPGFEGGQTPFFRRVPKRGFTNPFRKVTAIINLGEVDRLAERVGTVFTMETLENAGVLKGFYERLAVLGEGELKGKYVFKAHRFSETARQKIEAAGGSIEIVPVPEKFVREKRARNKK